MIVLAIDTALEQTAVAVFDSQTGFERAREQRAMSRGHAEALVPMIEHVMKAAELPFSALGRIAATVGPGSFTGIRIGLSAAKGLGIALGVPVVGVTTFAAYAAPLFEAAGEQLVVVALDARHGQIYFQAYSAGGVPLGGHRVLGIDEAARSLPAVPAVIAGSAGAPLASQARMFGRTAAAIPAGAGPDIGAVARIAAAAEPETAPASPLYLRTASTTLSHRPAILTA